MENNSVETAKKPKITKKRSKKNLESSAASSTTKEKATKSTAKSKSSSTKTAKKAATGSALSEDTRRAMIATAAYYRAESHGFNTDPVDDWLLAESEIDSQISAR